MEAKLRMEDALDGRLLSLDGGFLIEKKNNIRTSEARDEGGSGRMTLFVGRGFLSEKKNNISGGLARDGGCSGQMTLIVGWGLFERKEKSY